MRVTFEMPEILLLGSFYFYYMESIAFTIVLLVLGISGGIIRNIENQQLAKKLIDADITSSAIRNSHMVVTTEDVH